MGGRLWRGEELQTLRQNYGKVPIEELLELLPGRTEKGVRLRAFKLGLSPEMDLWSKEEDQILRDNYEHMPASQVVKLLNGRSLHATQQRIGKLGLTGERWACTHSANNDFFAVPNILSSYWAGFIAADGCIRGSYLSIQLKSEDGYHLERFAEDTGFTGRVAYAPPKKKKHKINGRVVNSSGSAQISVSCCSRWAADLLEHYSITPKKSLTLEHPKSLDWQCSLAFIKGYLDGDGCVNIRKDGALGLHFYGTESTVGWIKDILEELAPPTSRQKEGIRFTSSNTWHYAISGERAEVIARILAKLDTPELTRKWGKIEEYFKQKEEALRALRKTVDFPVFDLDKVFLGALCRRGHDYQGGGQSLRWKNSNACIRCSQFKQGIKTPMVPIVHQIERTKAIAPELDTAKFFLGTLCSQHHKYGDTEYTLRRTINRYCLECEKAKYQSKRGLNPIQLSLDQFLS
jgi:hypothetical protein